MVRRYGSKSSTNASAGSSRSSRSAACWPRTSRGRCGPSARPGSRTAQDRTTARSSPPARYSELPRRRTGACGGGRLGEPAGVDRVAQRRHQEPEVGEVVLGDDPRAGRLAQAEQVVQVRARIAGRARWARAAVAERLVGVAVAALGEVDAPAPLRIRHDRHPVAADPRRHRAVERVDAELYAAHEVVDVADPQQVAGPGFGQLLRGPADDLVHLRLVLAERPADREPERAAVGDLLRAPAPQVLLYPALDDPVDGLGVRPVALVPRDAPVEPAVRALGRARRVVARDVERQA